MNTPLTHTHSNQKAGTRERLMEAARAEFGDHGIEAATTRGIAERAECNEVTLFRHFESKQKLLAAVVLETCQDFHSRCECHEKLTGNLTDDLSQFAQVYDHAVAHYEGITRALIGVSQRRPTLAKELIGNVTCLFHLSIAEYLDRAKQTGAVRADLDSMAFAEIFTASLLSGLLRRNSGFSEIDRERWLRETVRLFVRGIQP